MTREELKEKICEISNSEFPLIDFFNDIDWLDDRHFNTEKAYEDIEKIYNVFVYYKDKVKKLEKELKQTKLNFRNSQIHSKNCYKKLKEKYTRLERAYKNNEVMTRDLNELINRNLELGKENRELEEHSTELFDRCALLTLKVEQLKQENQNLKEVMKNREEGTIELIKAIKILKDWFRFKVTKFNNLDGTFRYVLEYKVGLSDYGIILTEEQYELLKEVFESVGGEV